MGFALILLAGGKDDGDSSLKMLPSVFRFEDLPGLGFKISDDPVVFLGGCSVGSVTARDSHTSKIADLPSDSMFGMVEGKNEGFEF